MQFGVASGRASRNTAGIRRLALERSRATVALVLARRSTTKLTSWPAVTAVAVIPALLVFLATRQGIGLDWDATVYLSAADSFAEVGRVVDFYGEPLTAFAPGYSTLLGLLLKIGLGFNTAGVLIALLTLVIYVASTAVAARSVLVSTPLVWLAGVAVCVSVSTVRVFAYLKTDAPFMALLMLVVAACTWTIRAQHSPVWWMVAVGLTVSIATSVRYIGLYLIPLVGIATFVAVRQAGVRPAVVRAAIATGLSAVGLGVVVIRNLALGQPALGSRTEPTDRGLSDVLLALIKAFATPYVPAGSSATVELLGGSLVLVLAVAGAVTAVARRSWPAIWLAAMVCGYLAVMIYSQLTTNIQAISERLMAPIFAPALLLALYALADLARTVRGSTRVSGAPAGIPIALRVIAFVACVVVLVACLLTTVGFVADSNRRGLEYNSPASRNSPTSRAVAALPPTAGLAAMNAPKVYVATRRSHIMRIPWVNRVSSASSVPDKIEALKAGIDAGEVDYLVWFTRDARYNVITPEQLIEAGVPIHRVASYPDGSIWQPAKDS